MDEATRALLRVAVALGRRDRDGIEAALDAAATEADPVEVEELLLQSHLFLGYPASLNAFAAWRDRSGRAPPPAVPDDPRLWARRGEEVCGTVYGGEYARLRENIARLHPDMERWMVADGYGKVLGREGLSLARRELCTVALLAGQDAEAQLYSHLRGALNAGAAREEVEATVDLACAGLPPASASAVRETWRRVVERRRGNASPGDREPAVRAEGTD